MAGKQFLALVEQRLDDFETNPAGTTENRTKEPPMESQTPTIERKNLTRRYDKRDHVRALSSAIRARCPQDLRCDSLTLAEVFIAAGTLAKPAL